MNQKFQKGNLVKMLYGGRASTSTYSKEEGHSPWVLYDPSPDDIGRLAVVLGSYADEFGGENRKSFSIRWMDNGYEEAWKAEDQMVLIHEGGQYLIDIAIAVEQSYDKLINFMKTHQNKPIEEILKTSFDHKNYPCDIVIVGDMEKPMTSARFRTIQNYKAKIEAELKIKVGICNFLITGPAHLPDPQINK